MSSYSIEARSLSVAGVGGHSFWVLRDESGRAIAELHGLATNRETGRPVPIGTDEDKFSLRVWHYPHDSEYAASIGAPTTTASYIQEGQQSRTVLVADRDEVLARWNAAVAAKDSLNALDLDDPSLGIKLFGSTVNSNSTYRTLGEVMGLPVRGFPGAIEPGIQNRMADPAQIKAWRTHGYRVLDKPSVGVDGGYVEIGSKRADASSLDQRYAMAAAALGAPLALRGFDAQAIERLCEGIGQHCAQEARLGPPTQFLLSKDGSRVMVRYGEHAMSEILLADTLTQQPQPGGVHGLHSSLEQDLALGCAPSRA